MSRSPQVQYTLEHQRLEHRRGFVSCEPHMAARVVVLEVKRFPRAGKRHAYTITRVVGTYHGAGATAAAREELGRRIGHSASKPKRPQPWGRSLTRAEYDSAQGYTSEDRA